MAAMLASRAYGGTTARMSERRSRPRRLNNAYLCGADVAGRLVPADVLLSGLQSETIHLLPSCIPGRGSIRVSIGSSRRRDFRPTSGASPGDANHSAGHHPHQVIFNGEEGGVGAAVAERDPEPLGAAQRDIDAKLAGRTQHAESQQVRGAARQSLARASDQQRAAPLGHSTSLSQFKP